MRTTTLFCLASLVIFFALPMVNGWAQPSKPQAADTSRVKAATDVSTTKDKVRIFLDKIEILGRIEKPQTVFIIPGRDPSVDDIHIDRSFFKEIFRSIEKDDIAKRNRSRVRRP